MFDDAVASIALRHSDAMLRRNQTIVRENLAILDAWVAAHEHFYYTKPKAGTTAASCTTTTTSPSYDFCKRMYRETGAFVTPGDCFEQPPQHAHRLCLRQADPSPKASPPSRPLERCWGNKRINKAERMESIGIPFFPALCLADGIGSVR